MDKYIYGRDFGTRPLHTQEHETSKALNPSAELCSTSYFTLAKSLHFFEPQFLLLQNGVVKPILNGFVASRSEEIVKHF